MPLTPTLGRIAGIDDSSAHSTIQSVLPGAALTSTTGIGEHLAELAPLNRETHNELGRAAGLASVNRTLVMGSAVGGPDRLGPRRMTLTVDERSERAALRGASAGTLHLPRMPHVFPRAYTTPVLPSPAITGTRLVTKTGDDVGSASRNATGIPAIVTDSVRASMISTATTATTPAPPLGGSLLSSSPSSVIVVSSPTHAISGSPANITAEPSTAGGSVTVQVNDGPFSPVGTYTLPGYHSLAATVGAETPHLTGKVAGGGVSNAGLSEAQPFAIGNARFPFPNQLPPGLGSNAGAGGSSGHEQWEARAGPDPAAGWASNPAPVSANVSDQAQAAMYRNQSQEQDTRDMQLRRAGRTLLIEGWTPSGGSSSTGPTLTSIYPSHLHSQTPGAGPGPTTTRNVYAQEVNRQRAYLQKNPHTQSSSLSSSGSPESAVAGTPPRSASHDLDYHRFMDHTHPFMRPTTSTMNESTTADFAPSYSSSYSTASYSIQGRSQPHSQTLSPFSTAETQSPGSYRNTHTSAIDATVPGLTASSQAHMYSGTPSFDTDTSLTRGTNGNGPMSFSNQSDLKSPPNSAGPPSFPTQDANANFSQLYTLSQRPTIGETEATIGTEASARTSGISNTNTLLLSTDIPMRTSGSPFKSPQSFSYSSTYHQSHSYSDPHATFQSPQGSSVSGNLTSALHPSSSLPASAPDTHHDVVSIASRSQAPPASVSSGSEAAERRPLTSPSTLPDQQTPNIRPATSKTPQTGGSGNQQRKRVHPCWMCHKSFDRPSTLRKHLLVHTGEKAFACKICGRRFGVQSNLNRHERKCIQKPVHNKQAVSASASAALGSSVTVEEQASPTSPAADNSPNPRSGSAGASSPTSVEVGADSTGQMAREKTNPAHRQGRGSVSSQQSLRRSRSEPQPSTSDSQVVRSDAQGPNDEAGGIELTQVSTNVSATTSSGQSSVASGSGGTSVVTATTTATTPGVEGERRPKRRRRAPSPSRWVPASLAGFSLAPCRDQVQAPLPPVRPHYEDGTGFYEERDSFAGPPPGEEGDEENVDPAGSVASSSSGSGNGSGSNSPTGGINSAIGAGLSIRQRNFEYAPYHPCGWIGRLPGPAVDITNYHHVTIGAAGPSGSRGGGGGGSGFTYEFSLSASA